MSTLTFNTYIWIRTWMERQQKPKIKRDVSSSSWDLRSDSSRHDCEASHRILGHFPPSVNQTDCKDISQHLLAVNSFITLIHSKSEQFKGIVWSFWSQCRRWDLIQMLMTDLLRLPAGEAVRLWFRSDHRWEVVPAFGGRHAGVPRSGGPEEQRLQPLAGHVVGRSHHLRQVGRDTRVLWYYFCILY